MFAHKEISMRPVESQDLEKIRNLRNEQSTWQYLSDASMISESMQLQWFENVNRSLDDRYYTVEKTEFGEFLGVIRTDQIDLRNRSIRVGCDIVPEERGKGFGTMTFEMLLKYFFGQIREFFHVIKIVNVSRFQSSFIKHLPIIWYIFIGMMQKSSQLLHLIFFKLLPAPPL